MPAAGPRLNPHAALRSAALGRGVGAFPSILARDGDVYSVWLAGVVLFCRLLMLPMLLMLLMLLCVVGRCRVTPLASNRVACCCARRSSPARRASSRAAAASCGDGADDLILGCSSCRGGVRGEGIPRRGGVRFRGDGAGAGAGAGVPHGLLLLEELLVEAVSMLIGLPVLLLLLTIG